MNGHPPSSAFFWGRLIFWVGVGTLLLLTFSCTAPTPTQARPQDEPTSTLPSVLEGEKRASDPWSLWSTGVHLRGANIYQRRVYPDLDEGFLGPGPLGPPYTQADFDRLAALGANYVNISHPGLFSETPPYTLDEAVQANLDRLIDMAARAGLYVVITFRTGPGRSEFWAFWGEDTASDPENGWFDPAYYNNRVWGDRAAQDAWVAMWRYMAQRYKDNPVVVGYDLMCEPNANEVGSYPLGDPLDIWDPDEFYRRYGGTLYDWNQLYPRIIAAIRQVDPNTPILVGAMSYSAVDWLPYMTVVDAPRVVYTVHQYEPFVYTHQEPPDLTHTYPGTFDADWDGVPDRVDKGWLQDLMATVADFKARHHVPVAVNEFGVMRWEPGAAQFMADQMDIFENMGLNHALWLWETSWTPYASEVDAFNFRHGPDPNHHRDVADSALLRAIKDDWARNTERPFSPATYYVRPDGGSPEQCTGLVDAPYPGRGTHQPCAWDHPFRALPPGGTPRIRGGDTLIIASGQYMMGLGAPGADNPDVCDSAYPWSCHMPPIPSGPDPQHPTRILGQGWNTGCSNPPQLWGTQRADLILNLTDSSNVEIACLEITDHSSCVEFHSGDLACNRDTYLFGDWAAVGLYAEDSANVHLKDLNIHGLAHGGVWAGRLRDWTVENVRIVGNGWVGWDGDIEGDDANAGTLTFRHWTVAWNGCGETYPDGQPTGCWAQSAGGYGDGVGTGRTGGHWVIEDSAFLYNTSDGLDLLYAREPGASITIRRTIAMGNAGNGIKTNGDLHLENAVVVGNCGFFQGKEFTHNVDNCRAAGNALSVTLRPGTSATVVNSTITGHGDCLVELLCEGNCNGREALTLRNDLFVGHREFLDPGDRTCFVYHEGFPGNPVDVGYSIVYGAKGGCPAGEHVTCQEPRVRNPDESAFDGHLRPDSPAIDAGLSAVAPPTDVEGHPRDPHPDIGAYEYRGSLSRIYLPLVE